MTRKKKVACFPPYKDEKHLPKKAHKKKTNRKTRTRSLEVLEGVTVAMTHGKKTKNPAQTPQVDPNRYIPSSSYQKSQSLYEPLNTEIQFWKLTRLKKMRLHFPLPLLRVQVKM